MTSLKHEYFVHFITQEVFEQFLYRAWLTEREAERLERLFMRAQDDGTMHSFVIELDENSAVGFATLREVIDEVSLG